MECVSVCLSTRMNMNFEKNPSLDRISFSLPVEPSTHSTTGFSPVWHTIQGKPSLCLLVVCCCLFVVVVIPTPQHNPHPIESYSIESIENQYYERGSNRHKITSRCR